MNVSSYLELYLGLFGWVMFDQIWTIITASGLAYLPFIGMLLKNIVEPMTKQDYAEAATASIRGIEQDLFKMLAVVVLATQPLIKVDFNSLSYTKACSATTATTVNLSSTGTTYDQVFSAATLGGNSAKVPIWWYAVLMLSGGFDDAVINAIPCSADVRLVAYKMENARIKDPDIRRQVQLFYNDCYSYGVSRYLEQPSTVPMAKPDDLYWLGSAALRPAYQTKRASEPVPGFPYSANRDVEYDTAIETPSFGKPTCAEWWNGTNASDAKFGLRAKILSSVPADDFNNFNSIFSVQTSRFKASAEDIAIKSLINREKSYFNGYANLAAYNDGTFDVANNAVGLVGSAMESLSFFPKIYMVKTAAPILQACLLMLLYALLPLLILLSSYDIKMMILVAVAIFSVKFWTVLWALANWLDNHLTAALRPTWVELSAMPSDTIAEFIIMFVTGGMFVALPVLWSGLLGWAGFQIGSALTGFSGDGFRQAGAAGGQGTQTTKKFALKPLKPKG